MNILSVIAAVLSGLPWTIALTIAAFIAGALVAIPLCMLRVAKNSALQNIAAGIILIVRSIPPIVWLFAVFFAFGQHVVRLDPFSAAVMGLAIITAANMAEIYRGAMKAIPRGQFEAAQVIGLSTWQKYRHVIGPQIFRYALPSASTFAIGLLKDTAIASAIGVPEVALVANQLTQKTFKGLEIYAVAAVCYFALSFAMAYVARIADEKLRARIER
ncbi:amino acid ABC transporter permease [Pseudomonas sp. NY15181]|uniref:amino acid ABC transporter permease n=1 Tax=Pseudomonas sp. NY15181 TaxID=3400349 RepID=UPI003A8B2156